MSRLQERPHVSVHRACVCTKGRLSPCNEILETGVRRPSSVRQFKRGCACGPVIWRPGLGHTLEMLYCGIRPRTFGECRSPRVLFEGTCDVALTCSKQQASALTTRKPLRRPTHPVMNDDSQRLSPTKPYSHAKPVKAFPRCSAFQHWRLRGHGAAVCRGLLENASHEPSRLRCGPNQVTRSVCAKMIGTAQVIDLLGGPAAEDPKIPNIRLVNACRPGSPGGCSRRAANCNET